MKKQRQTSSRLATKGGESSHAASQERGEWADGEGAGARLCYLCVISDCSREQRESILHSDSSLDDVLTEPLQSVLTVRCCQVQKAYKAEKGDLGFTLYNCFHSKSKKETHFFILFLKG